MKQVFLFYDFFYHYDKHRVVNIIPTYCFVTLFFYCAVANFRVLPLSRQKKILVSLEILGIPDQLLTELVLKAKNRSIRSFGCLLREFLMF